MEIDVKMADIQQTTNKQHRMLKISILRFNPQDPESVPRMQIGRAHV